jgi:hypothetical protein
VEEHNALVARAQTVLARELARVVGQWEEGDLGQVERVVQQVLRQVGAAVVEGAVAVRVARARKDQPACPGCGKRLRLVGSARERHLQGLVGDYCLRRPYYQCRGCTHGAAPLDAALGLGSAYCSPGLAQVTCRLGIETSFGQVTELVGATLGVAVDDATVCRLVERVGVIAELAYARQDAWGLAPGAAVPPCLLVSLDGVLVPERDGWHAAKVGRVGPLGPAVQHDRKTGRATLRLGRSTYCVGVEEAQHFWPRLAREAVRCGLGQGVRVVVLLGDGAEWIWIQGRTQLGLRGVAVVEILDMYHACEHLGTVASAVFARTPLRRTAWLTPLRRQLRDQGPAPILRALARLRPTTPSGREEVRKAIDYCTEHAARRDYPAFAARQFPIGSGAIESTCRHLVQLRAVQAGMRWRADHLQAVLSLRAVARSGRWAAFWATQPLLHARLHRAATTATATPPVDAQPPSPPALLHAPAVAPAPDQPAPQAAPTAASPAGPAPAPRPRAHPRAHPWRARLLTDRQSA